MRTFAVALLLLAGRSLQAQELFVDNEPDTLLPVFATTLENDAYEAVKYLSKAFATDTGIVSVNPLVVRFWSRQQGWDVLVFDLEDGKTVAYHYDFSGEYSDNVNKRALLIALAKKKCPE